MPKKGYKQTKAHINKSRYWPGRRHSKKTKRKMAKTRRKIWQKDRERLSSFMRGIKKSSTVNMKGNRTKRTEEHKRIVSVAFKKKWKDPIYRAKMKRVTSKRMRLEWANGLHKPTSNGIWKRGRYRGIWLRSSWELSFAKYLDREKINWKYEPKRFKLRSGRTYCPDFFLPKYDKYIEIKGWWTKAAKRKFKQFRSQYPEIKIEVLEAKTWEKQAIVF